MGNNAHMEQSTYVKITGIDKAKKLRWGVISAQRGISLRQYLRHLIALGALEEARNAAAAKAERRKERA